jgi:putative ABC transport system permease protein
MLRTPLRSGASVIGVALAVALLVTAMQWNDAITLLVRGHFQQSQHQDAVIGFLEPKGPAALHALDRLPGVMAVEPLRMVSADLSHGRFTHRGGLTGLPEGSLLQLVHDVGGWDIPVPPGGVVLGTFLADKLGVVPGDRIEVEVLERDHPRFTLPVAAVHETWIAMPAYVSLSTLNRAMGDAPEFEYAMLRVDPASDQALFDAVSDLPGVASFTVKRHAIEKMFETLGDTILIFSGFFIAFAGDLAYGVV